jgi:Tol biopolymer transport system component
VDASKTAWVYAPLVQVIGDAAQIAVVEADAAAPANVTASNTTTSTATSATTATTTTKPVATTGGVSAVPPGLLSGRLLYSVANDDAKRWELWEYNFANSENKKIADWRTEIDVSSDGKQIVYFAWPGDAGEKVGIWIMDADFTKNRLVVPGGAYPSFSPGGDRLVVNGRDELYVLKTDGANIRKLTNGEYAAWSPVNNQIVHRACVGGRCGLWLIDADSNDPGARNRITTGGSDGQPAWSPDGKRVAYISQEDGNFEIYVVNQDGSNKLRLTTNPSSDGLPVWSPDGAWIAFRSDRGGSWAIYVMRADGSDVRKVVDADVLPLWFFEKMDWRR